MKFYILDKDGKTEFISKAITSSNIINLFVYNEIPNGIINGVNATFTTLYNFNPSTLEVFLNGLKQKIINDYQSIGNNTIQLSISINVGEILSTNYQKI